jgi:hypothetical protein
MDARVGAPARASCAAHRPPMVGSGATKCRSVRSTDRLKSETRSVCRGGSDRVGASGAWGPATRLSMSKRRYRLSLVPEVVATNGGTPTLAGSATTRARGWRTIAAIVVPPIVLGFLAWSHRWTADDGFIHLRVVDQLLHGHGLVFNAGERVEASTSPLWVVGLGLGRIILLGRVRLEYIGLWGALLASVFGLAAAGFAARSITGWTEDPGASRLVVP